MLDLLRYADPNIVCPQCGRRSFHPKDVSERYCVRCHQFHDDMKIVKASEVPAASQNRSGPKRT